jgi:hypothetical protein
MMSRLGDILRNLVGRGPREAGPRRPGNGASSFHLIWEMPAGVDKGSGASRAGSGLLGAGSGPGLGPGSGLVEASAVLEIVEPPRGEALYYWALQVDFWAGGEVWGCGHTGLQWNKRYPEHRAVNWGGYFSAERGGAVLPGTRSLLSGFTDDPNTLTYAWQPGRPYQLRVYRSPEILSAWRAEVRDLVSGVSSVIRDLLPADGTTGLDSYLVRPLVWSEVFAACDAPSVMVRWSDLRAIVEGGGVVRPSAVRVNYQSVANGGCPNTTVVADEAGGFLQVTNVPRIVGQGVVLPLLPRSVSRREGGR